MTRQKLSAPVGANPRPNAGPKVRNATEDVKLVQLMLETNGCAVEVTGRVDAGLVNVILDFQKKKTKLKTPDGVIDPGGPTFKALLPRFKADQAKLAKMQLVKFRLKGKEFLITEKQRKEVEADILKKCATIAKIWRSQHDMLMDFYQEYLDNATLKNGIMDAITQAIVTQIRFDPIDLPSVSIVTGSTAAISALERAVKSKDLARVEKAMVEAEKKLKSFDKAMMGFIKNSGASAGAWATGAEITSTVSFGIVSVMAAPVAAGALGVSAATGAVVASAGTAAIKSSASELGSFTATGKGDLGKSAKNIVVDTMTDGAAAFAGGKLSKGASSFVAGKLASKTAGVSDDLAKVFWKRWLIEASGEVTKSAGEDAIKLGSDALLKNKKVGKKEVIDTVFNASFSLASAGPMKDLENWAKPWAVDPGKLKNELIRKKVTEMVDPDTANRILRSTSVVKGLSKAAEAPVKEGLKAGIQAYNGKGNMTQMQKAAEKAALNEPTFDRLVKAVVDRELKGGR